MWPCGTCPGSSSSVATRRMTVSLPGCRAMICVPQRLQKWRSLPGDDGYAVSMSAPDSHRKCSCRTVADVLKAAACALRQVRHEQCRMGESSCETSYRTCPQRQLPRIGDVLRRKGDEDAPVKQLASSGRACKHVARVGPARLRCTAQVHVDGAERSRRRRPREQRTVGVDDPSHA